jgi:zinc protease
LSSGLTVKDVMEAELIKVQLANGLRVMLKEIHTTPLVSQWMWYRVGSRDELPGLTGVSHWVEHMLFKGTPDFPSGEMDKAIARLGGYWNAMTFLDWTTYFATMPAGEHDIILQLERDRILNSVFDPAVVESERTVIISERQGNENSPLFLLVEAVQSNAFQTHTYGHEVIGSTTDLQSMTRQQLYGHYRSYYVPNNAVLSIAGDINSQEMLDRIQELFDSIPIGPEPPRPAVPEPPQQTEKYLSIGGPGETSFMQIAYHMPPTSSQDFFIFSVLDSLLTGPSNLNIFGGGISNTTSLLYQDLVEEEIAVSVVGDIQATIDPYIYNVLLTVHPKHTPEKLLENYDAAISRLQDAPPHPDTLERAMKQARALFAYGSESIPNQAFWLGFAEMFDSYEWFDRYLDRLAMVTPQDVQRVAQQYLQKENRVVGVYRPYGNGR